MAEHRYDIERFIVDLTEIPSSDPLVDLSANSGKQAIELSADYQNGLSFPLDSQWNALLKFAADNKREADVQSLCLALDTLEWEYKGKIVQSPLVLVPLDWKINKATKQVALSFDANQAILNPFVHYHFIRTFGSTPEEQVAESLTEFLEKVRNEVSRLLPTAHFIERQLVGNFHHHRYQIIRELERIKELPASRLVASVLGNESKENAPELALHKGLLSPSDADQLEVFTQLTTNDLVVQGPPGTGKSQVLTNLLGKTLLAKGMTLVVSEKRVALEVLVKKLADFQLDIFAFIAHSQSQPRDFIRQLKTTWLELEKEAMPESSPLFLSEQLTDALQLLLDRLNHPTLAAGISFRELEELEKGLFGENIPFRSDVPDLRTWLSAQTTVNELSNFPGGLDNFRYRKYAFVVHPNADRMAAHLANELAGLQSTFQITHFTELDELVKTSARLQLIDNESFRAYFDLFAQPAKQKKFEKAAKRFREISARIALLENEQHHWKRPLTLTETSSWLKKLDEKQAWWRRSKIPPELKKLLTDPKIDPQTALGNWLTYLQLQEEEIDLRARFASWGIDRPEVELESASYILQRLEQENENELNRVLRLSDSDKQALRLQGNNIRQLRDDCLRYLLVTEETLLAELQQLLENSAKQSGDLLQLVKNLPESVYRILSSCKTVEEAHQIVVHSNRQLLARQFPELAKYSGEFLYEKLENILATEAAESQQFARYVRSVRQQRFAEALELLRQPANRLSAENKARKSTLKAGKALLVREFAKTRQHATIRELLSGPAGSWIEILCPVWLSTPAQVGKLFPMQQELFELVTFDEASQIPLANALGALQRSRRAIVAGDEQQMAPTSYFSGSKVSVDLLHQAGWYWKKTALKHHYRSEHPELIRFSNKHFYKNELVAYPTAGATFPLHLHFCPDGKYIDRTNIPEAKAVARFLETIPENKSLGIIAFSEQQLQCIRQQLSLLLLERLEEGVENGQVFFKALEQVQGDEADSIVVSMGFGRNEDDRFQLRFGPLNQAQGFKRLNVLLTRARTSLHFFTSVQSADFSISTNESVNLLRQFLQQLESQDEHAKNTPFGNLPFGLQVDLNTPSIQLPFIYNAIPDSRELVTFHRVMLQRKWKVFY